MGYIHIDNLYKNTDILLLRECFAMEKIHGTSAHLAWNEGKLRLFAGGEKQENFEAVFNIPYITELLIALGHPTLTVYGEAYGGKCQGMKTTYGDKLKFVAFDVKINETFLSVPNAHEIVNRLGLEFVHYVRCSTDLEILDAQRDAPSEQAFRNGCASREDPTTWKKREGIVLRPLFEMYRPGRENGRIISKHKAEGFCERKTPQVVDEAKREVLANAEKIADEWVTDMRLAHVLDKLGNPREIDRTGEVIKAMLEDVFREAAGEVVDSKDARRAVGSRTAQMYKKLVTTITQET